MNFEDPSYLILGNERQREAYAVLKKLNLFERLIDYSPVLAGTIPLNIDVADSDLDIICEWKNKPSFIDSLKDHFSSYAEFTLSESVINQRTTVIASFREGNFAIEIFGQNRPVREQEGYKHMIIEHAILKEGGEVFRQQIIALKQQGVKTEPAFAQLLGLGGNPYQALLKYGERFF